MNTSSPASRTQPIDLLIPIAILIRQRVALGQFLARAITRRYRMSALGLLWTVVIPLATLAIYTFVFGVVIPTTWSDGGTTSFALRLFSGLIVFWLMAEVITSAPSSVVEQTNLVKKSVFPLEIIPAVTVAPLKALLEDALVTFRAHEAHAERMVDGLQCAG